jgi:hypothetical protein
MKSVQHPPSRPFLSVLFAAILVLIGWGADARAQFGAGMDMGQFAAPISRRSLEDYGKLVNLTADQKEAVKSLYDAYTAAHAEVQKEMTKTFQEVAEKAQDTGDFKVYQKELPKKMQALNERMEKLEKGFYDDAKALLTTEQQASWSRVERHRRREKGLRFGFISGQSVDMVKVVDALKLDPKSVPGLTDEVEHYEADMDRAIQAFEKFGKDQEKEQAKWAEDFDMSKMAEMMEKAKSVMTQMLDIGKGMRDVNRQYQRTILPLLPEDQREKFEAEFNKRAYPRIYREGYPSKALAAAAGFNDLTADQSKTIAEMKAEYAREVAATSKKWALATQEREDKTGGQMMEMMSMMGGGGGDESVKEAANKAREDRKDLDKRYKEKLLALLNEGQRDRLPEEKKEPGGMFGMAGGDFFMPPDDEPEPGK